MGNLIRCVWNVQQGLEELVIVGSRGIHDGHADRHAPPRIDTVRQRRIKQIDVIDNLRMLGFALGLFCRSNKMTERMLVPVSHGNRPVVCGESPLLLRTKDVSLLGIGSAAQRANHGRARSRCYSTLTPCT